MDLKRREFLEFMGRLALATPAFAVLSQTMGCSTLEKKPKLHWSGLGAIATDDLVLVDGLKYQMLIRWKDPITDKLKFGSHNDYIAFTQLSGPEHGILWVNHEYMDPSLVHERDSWQNRTKAEVEKEMTEVGGSLIEVRRDPTSGKWQVVHNSKYNRRLDGNTMIPFAGDVKVLGQSYARGTFANCAGGQTPWGTVLTCEENYQDFYGDVTFDENGKRQKSKKPSDFGWEKYFDRPPEHYGWVVEVNPRTGKAKKHTSLGRFGHECATCVKAADGRTVVYSGDDLADECIYKFISSKPGDLTYGTLYVADTVNGKWLPLDLEKDERLKAKFKTQLEVMIRTREASRTVGGTPHDRPEDIEQDPLTKAMFITLTNNVKKKNYFGSILKIEEKNKDPLSLEFKASVFKAGGPQSGFSCPDNLAFDKAGNLWFCSDISGKVMNTGEYKPFGNNGLFYTPLRGPLAGQIFKIGSAPNGAEITGLCFSPSGDELFVSIQHPGEDSPSLASISSHWPEGGSAIPLSSVVVLSGALMKDLTQ